MTSGAIAARFDCTWQTTSRRLRLLEEAGFIHVSLGGSERNDELDAERFSGHTIGFVHRFDSKRRSVWVSPPVR